MSVVPLSLGATKGRLLSRANANSEYRQCLTNDQEEVLICQINKLTVRHMPPTSQIVKNIAEEICGREVNKNWTAYFIRRHQDRLHNLYLRNIDNQRAHAEYSLMFEHFYALVCPFNTFDTLDPQNRMNIG
jgi:hypothetical protein